MTVRRAVLSYVNPDTDGVACMLAYKELIDATADGVIVEPAVFGRINAETLAVLDHVGLEPPGPAEALLAEVDEICLVDTHHRTQLPPSFPVDRVVEVIDHHGAGDITPQYAAVHNEPVGAAATLLVERFRRAERRPTSETAVLLGAAILSNTLDLTAPSTTERDEAALQWLELGGSLSTDLVNAMHRGRELLIIGDTTDLLLADVKVFTRPSGEALAMSQIEAPNATTLAQRPDLLDAVVAVASRSGASDAVVNLADTSLGKSLLVCVSPSLQDQLHRSFDVVFDDSGRAWTNELFLRKTHLVPALIRQ